MMDKPKRRIRHLFVTTTIAALAALAVGFAPQSLAADGDWYQAQGPNGNNVVAGKAPIKFSVTHNENIIWKSDLPNTGQGTVVISNGKAFVLSHAPITQDEKRGTNTVGQAFDVETGELLWTREIPGIKPAGLSSLFSDNTAASAVASDKYVAFVNVGGQIAVFDHDGNEIWRHNWVPHTRTGSRQNEPFLVDGQLIVYETLRDDLPPEKAFKDRAEALGDGKENWSHLHAYDLKTGELNWVAEAGTSGHGTSMLGRDKNGHTVILTGRGGAHQPLEMPYGMSSLSVKDGTSNWDTQVTRYRSHQNVTSDSRGVYGFTPEAHVWLDPETGAEVRRTSLYSGVTVRRWTGEAYATFKDQVVDSHRNRPITYQTNIVVGDYHYFRPTPIGYIGRVNLLSGAVELLQVPVQIVRKTGEADRSLWNEALKIELRNSDGFIADSASKEHGTGWGHISGPASIAVGNAVYFPTVTGMVYVIDGSADVLDERALLAINDLGPAEETWTLSSLSYDDGRLYARTLKELICIGEE
ncbi:MAG: PQQ-binding-like beta-propeller repeat protein [Litorimonas sp.]